jgi:hypothetical protein
MPRLSNTHTLSISAAAGSTLAAAAAALGSNQWGSITTVGYTSALITGSAGDDSIISWGRKCYWDAPRGRLLYYGISHNGSGSLGGVSRIIKYVESTNTWSVENDNVAADPNYPLGGGNHGYDQFAYRPTDGQLFIKRSKTGRVFTRTATNTTNSWTELTTIPGVENWEFGTADALQWHPGLNGGSGGLVHCGPAAIYISNAAVSSWTVLRSATGTSGLLSMQGINNQLDSNNVYIGGGSGNTIMWRIAANGTLTQQGNTPVAYSVNPWPMSGAGSLFRGPGTQKPFIIRADGTINEYTFSSNSWSGTITTIPFSPDQGLYIGGPIDELNVSVFMYNTGSITPSSTMWIWKR